MRINSKEELQSKKAEIEQNIQSFTCGVLVCSGTGCMASGAQKIYDEMVRLCEGIDGVEIEMQKDIPHITANHIFFNSQLVRRLRNQMKRIRRNMY